MSRVRVAISPDVLRDIIATALFNHPKECLFREGAATRIFDKADHAHWLSGWNGEALIDALEEAIKAEEIYCPHEGIDRRAEFGMAA